MGSPAPGSAASTSRSPSCSCSGRTFAAPPVTAVSLCVDAGWTDTPASGPNTGPAPTAACGPNGSPPTDRAPPRVCSRRTLLMTSTGTAVRPSWDQLPADLRHSLAARLGDIVDADVQTG